MTKPYPMPSLKRSLILTFLSILMVLDVLGQNRAKDIPKDDFWYKWHMDKASQLGLTDLSNSSSTNYWRIWYTLQTISYAVDIYKGRDSLRKGFVTLYTEEYVDETKELPTKRIYTNKVPLAITQIDSIYKLIQDLHIAQIPNETDIKGWSQGLDGIIYCIESITANRLYTFKSYWTPGVQDSVKEASIIRNFVDRIDSVANLKQLLKGFTKQIPFESYSTGGPAIASRVLTLQQRRTCRRERDKYRKMNNIRGQVKS